MDRILTDSQIRELLAAHRAGVTRAVLAARFGVSPTTVRNITRGRHGYARFTREERKW